MIVALLVLAIVAGWCLRYVMAELMTIALLVQAVLLCI